LKLLTCRHEILGVSDDEVPGKDAEVEEAEGDSIAHEIQAKKHRLSFVTL
jgi:hypothetical protein